MSMNGLTYAVFGFFFLLVIGVFVLQYHLSKNENRWLGLLLPAISFIYSVIAVLGYQNYDGSTGVEMLAPLLSVFLLQNIPTLILMAIYFSNRTKLKKNAQLNKMKIKDL